MRIGRDGGRSHFPVAALFFCAEVTRLKKRKRTKLTSGQVLMIKSLYIDGRTRDAQPDRTQAALAAMFKVTPSQLSRILRGHVT